MTTAIPTPAKVNSTRRPSLARLVGWVGQVHGDEHHSGHARAVGQAAAPAELRPHHSSRQRSSILSFPPLTGGVTAPVGMEKLSADISAS
jgi:hypothetical protein